MSNDDGWAFYLTSQSLEFSLDAELSAYRELDYAPDHSAIAGDALAGARTGKTGRHAAGFANPDVFEYLEAEGIKYAIRLPANRVLQDRIGYPLTCPVGRPPNLVRRFHANFHYQAVSCWKPRRVVVKVEWRPAELCPRVGFIVTNMA